MFHNHLIRHQLMDQMVDVHHNQQHQNLPHRHRREDFYPMPHHQDFLEKEKQEEYYPYL
jgi:hypothetical protein